jgi:N-dimethylarginine dimethylaminohydrolase
MQSPAVLHAVLLMDCVLKIMERPDFDQMLKDHAHYVATLRETGAEIIELPALDEFPDAVFVEDDALCLKNCAILMRPGAVSRMGEVAMIASAIRAQYDDISEITGPGFIEGGDILTTSREILIGKSARTDAAGVEELRAIVETRGYVIREVQTPPDVLHFKTDCSLLDETRFCLPSDWMPLGVLKGTVCYTPQMVKILRQMPLGLTNLSSWLPTSPKRLKCCGKTGMKFVRSTILNVQKLMVGCPA